MHMQNVECRMQGGNTVHSSSVPCINIKQVDILYIVIYEIDIQRRRRADCSSYIYMHCVQLLCVYAY